MLKIINVNIFSHSNNIENNFSQKRISNGLGHFVRNHFDARPASARDCFGVRYTIYRNSAWL